MPCSFLLGFSGDKKLLGPRLEASNLRALQCALVVKWAAGDFSLDLLIFERYWLALPVGNEGPSTFTGWYIGDETSRKFPTSRAS